MFRNLQKRCVVISSWVTSASAKLSTRCSAAACCQRAAPREGIAIGRLHQAVDPRGKGEEERVMVSVSRGTCRGHFCRLDTAEFGGGAGRVDKGYYTNGFRLTILEEG